MEHLDTEVYVRVEFTDDSQPVTMWEYETFVDRLFLMRELYTNFVECGRDLGQALQTVDKVRDRAVCSTPAACRTPNCMPPAPTLPLVHRTRSSSSKAHR